MGFLYRKVFLKNKNMNKKILTDTFQFVSYPKPIKPPKLSKYQRLMTKKGRKHKKSLPSISSLKKKANLLFSNFIRSRDKYTCVLCKFKGDKTTIDNGHLIKRSSKLFLFSELNCHALCKKCNYKDWKDGTYHDVYVAWFIKNYGAFPYADMVERKDSIKQLKRLDYLEIIDKYDQKSWTIR